MKRILGAIQKAMYDFEMIKKGDKIAVGVSGGKDSLTLLTALSKIKKFFEIPFDLLAIHINMNNPEADITEFNAMCDYIRSLDIDLVVEDTRLFEILFKKRKEKNPCSLCSNIRRGALNTVAKREGCNKIALGHHADDVIETFFLSLLYESRLSTFKPVSYLDRSDMTLIRPMVYVNEKKIIGASKNLPVLGNPCPANKNTQRQYMKELIERLNQEVPKSRERIFNAIIHPERNNLWDLQPTEKFDD